MWSFFCIIDGGVGWWPKNHWLNPISLTINGSQRLFGFGFQRFYVGLALKRHWGGFVHTISILRFAKWFHCASIFDFWGEMKSQIKLQYNGCIWSDFSMTLSEISDEKDISTSSCIPNVYPRHAYYSNLEAISRLQVLQSLWYNLPPKNSCLAAFSSLACP